MVKKVFLLILTLFFLLSDFFIYAESTNSFPLELEEESPVSLFDYQINDSHIEFFANGSWESTVLGGFTFTKEKEEPISFSFNPFAFTQNVDLSVWFLLNNKWYFEAAFQDGFEKNTVAAGYFGDGILKHARIGNRGISFGDNYPIKNIGGGNNQAPGLMAYFNQDNWDATMLLRYDMKQNMSLTFMGDNELTENDISFADYEKGKIFVLPENTIQQITTVYVESSTGSFLDSDGRKYRSLSSSEYLLIFSSNTLVLAEKAEGRVLIDFSDKESIVLSLGVFGTYETEGSGYLGEIQAYFSQDNERKFNLIDYSWGTSDSSGFFTKINNSVNVMIIQNPPYFSPFVSSNYYNLYTKDTDSISIISESTGKASSSFKVIVTEEFQSLTNKDFMTSTYDYAEVFSIDDESLASTMFPLANILPEVYLLSSEDAKTEIQRYSDDCIHVVTTTPISSYVIGTDAIPGTITVYRDGIQDENFTFDENTGIITFLNKPTNVERIEISWQEESSDATSGSIVAALGLSYKPIDVLTFSGALAFQWAATNGVSYTTEENESMGFLSFALMARYNDFGLDIKDTVTTSLEAKDTTGVFRVDSMSSEYSSEIYLSSTSGVSLSSEIIPSLNDRGQESFPTLFLSDRIEDSSFTEVRNSGVDGYVIQSKWKSTNPEGSDLTWTAQSIDFVSATDLQSAKRFSIKMLLSSLVQDFDVYLQLGVNADSALTYENSLSIPTWKISSDNELELSENVKSSFIINSSMIDEWQTVEIELSDVDRSRLATYQDARIIIVQYSDNTGTATEENVILVGPYQYSGSSYSVTSNDVGVTGITYQVLDSTLVANDLVKSMNTDSEDNIQNTVQFFGFNKSAGSTWQENIEFVHYVNSVSLSSYKELSFYLYVPNIIESPTLPSFKFTIDSSSTQKGVSLLVDSSVLEIYRGSWNQIRINLLTGEVYVEDKLLSVSDYECVISNDASVSRIKINLIPSDTENTEAGSGYYLLDEVLLTGVIPEFSVKNEVMVLYKKEGTILQIKDFPILQDVSLSTESTQKISSLNDTVVLSGSVSAEAVISGIKTNFTAIHEANNEDFITNANHLVSTTSIIPVLGFSESYFYSPLAQIYRKNTSVSLTSPFDSFPFFLSLASNVDNEYSTQKQEWDAKANFSIDGEKTSYIFSFSGISNQLSDGTSFVNNYGGSWYNGSVLQLSEGLESAYKRQVKMELMQQLRLPFAQFSPSFTVALDNVYKNTTSTNNKASSTLSLKCPFNINSNVFSFNITRLGVKENSLVSGGTYLSDFSSYIDSLSSQSYLFTSIPFYELFDLGIADRIDSVNTGDSIFSYNSSYDLSWKRSLLRDFRDYLIPSSMNLALAKDVVDSGSSNFTDIFQLKATLGFMGLNSFGRLSLTPIFTFFDQDEYISSYSCTLKFNAQDGSYTDYLVSGFSKISMFFTKDNVLSDTTEFQVTTQNWKVKNSLGWKRPGKAEYLVKMAAYIFRDIAKESFKLNRITTLSYANSYLTSISTNSTYTNAIELTHDEELKAGNYLVFTTKLSGLLTIKEEISTFAVDLSLIGKVSF